MNVHFSVFLRPPSINHTHFTQQKNDRDKNLFQQTLGNSRENPEWAQTPT